MLNRNNLGAAAIYGSMELSSRMANLSQFQKDLLPVLVVTDVAARGLDIPLVNTVIHYDCPSSPKLFVHRSGRTARGGRDGTAVVLVIVCAMPYGQVNTTEIPYLLDICLYLGTALQPAPAGLTHPFCLISRYRWRDLTPQQVHYGRFPRSVLDVETHALEALVAEDVDLWQLKQSMDHA